MKSLPRLYLVIILAAAAIVAVFFFGRSGLVSPNQKSSAGNAHSESSSTPPVAESPAVVKPLRFLFADDSVAEISDGEPNSYTFYIDNQFIGVIVLEPPRDGPKNFEQWVSGLKGKITVSGSEVSVKQTKINNRLALAFETGEEKEKAVNLMTEVEGRVLWLQSRGEGKTLEHFLEKLTAIQENKS